MSGSNERIEAAGEFFICLNADYSLVGGGSGPYWIKAASIVSFGQSSDPAVREVTTLNGPHRAIHYVTDSVSDIIIKLQAYSAYESSPTA